jgi:hypothetical protein
MNYNTANIGSKAVQNFDLAISCKNSLIGELMHLHVYVATYQSIRYLQQKLIWKNKKKTLWQKGNRF